MSHNGRTGQLLLELIKCLLASLCPVEWDILPSQVDQRLGLLGVVLDESPVIITESQESLDICWVPWCEPLCERLKSQNRKSTELEADWQIWWSCKQLPLPINSCYEAALAGWCILSSLVLELL